MNKFETCCRLHDLGFPSSKRDGSLYYVTQKLKIKAENAVYLQSDTEFGTFQGLIFEPSLENLLHESKSYFTQIIQTIQSGVFAYSNIEEKKENGDVDPFMRAGGDDMWFALANLWIKVAEMNNRTVSSDELNDSENKSYATEKEI